MRIARYVAAATVALAGLGLASPAHATTRALTLFVSGPIAPSGSVPMIGSGCNANDPVSLDVWDTSKPTSHIVLPHFKNATSAGSFGYTYQLANQFDPGAEIGFYFSCTATVDWTWDPSTQAARTKYVQTTIADPHVTIEAPASSTYGTSQQVIVHTDAVFGNVSLTLDGVAQDLDPASVYGTWIYHLPRTLAVGSHGLHATWTPQASGSPTVTADGAARVTKIHPTLGLRLSPSTMRVGNTTAARVTLSHTGAAPRTGKVVLKKHGRIIATGQIRTADNGVRIFAVRIRTAGTYHLTAVFLGTSTLARATSPTPTLTVHR